MTPDETRTAAATSATASVTSLSAPDGGTGRRDADAASSTSLSLSDDGPCPSSSRRTRCHLARVEPPFRSSSLETRSDVSPEASCKTMTRTPRLTSRRAYIYGFIIATSVLTLPACLLLMILAMSYHTFSSPPCGPTCIQGATFGNMLIGGLGLLINCIIALTLTVLLSRPIATLLGQILFLTWLFAVRVENSNIGLIVHYLDWTQILLTPVVVCANIGTGTLNWYNAAMILVAIGYIGMLTMMAQLFFQGAISSYIDAFVTFLEGGLRC